MCKHLFFLAVLAIFFTACNLVEKSSPPMEQPRIMNSEVMSVSSSDIEQMRDTALRDFLLAQILEAELKDSFRLDTTFNKVHVHISAGDLLGTGNKIAFILYAQNEKNDNWEARTYTWQQQKRKYIKSEDMASGLWLKLKNNKVELAFEDINHDGQKDIYVPSGNDWGQVFLATADGGLQFVFNYTYYMQITYDDSSKIYKSLRNYSCPEGTKPTDKKKKESYVACVCEFKFIQIDGRWEIEETKRECPCK
jgi:hypothetical protein